MAPGDLQEVLAALTPAGRVKPDLLVGLGEADDAAVWRLGPELAIVETVDFFPPVVDDPWTWGAVAAANAMSDVYAMGGEVLFALNIAAWPEDAPLSQLGNKRVIAALLIMPFMYFLLFRGGARWYAFPNQSSSLGLPGGMQGDSEGECKKGKEQKLSHVSPCTLLRCGFIARGCEGDEKIET